MEDWVTIPYSSNKLKQTYFQNFVDISGVMSVRNSNNINLYTSGSTPDFSINSHQIRVKENETYYDISNSKLRFIQNLYENVQDKLEDLTSRTQYLTTSSNDGKAIFGSSIEISNNLICFSDLSLSGNLFIENYSTFNGQVDICGNLYANYPNNSIPISAVTNLESNLNTKSNLNSPEFTGIPLSPTAASGTNTNQIATTAFVADAVSGKANITYVDASLNVKADLASPTFTGTVSGITKSMVGLGNVDDTSDASKPVSTAQQTALDLKADLASPSFTGTPTAPTAASGTNTTQIATTAFVADAVSSLGGGGGSSIDLNQDISVNTLTVGIGAGDISTNSVFGYQALASNVSGYENVANGFTALTANTTGYRNIATGFQSLKNNTEGYHNIAIGYQALHNNTTSAQNIAIGSRSLSSSNGSANVALGLDAGLNNSTGSSYNTFLGSATDNIGTSNFSTALGYGAQITASNQIMLGRTTETVVAPNRLAVGSTTVNKAMLEVNGSINYIDPNVNEHDSWIYNYDNYAPWIGQINYANQTNVYTFSVWAQHDVKADRFIAIDNNAYSDRRIKQNIVDVPDNLALQQVRDIPCRYYDYVDPIRYKGGQTIGFIAQEVKEVLPTAITYMKEFIPDEYRVLTDITWHEEVENNQTIYKLSTDLTDVSGIKYKFVVAKDENDKPITKEIIGNSDNTFTFDLSYSNVFCYGKEVDDFHTVNKAKIFALHHSAIQEIDRIQLEEKDKVAVLETKITELEAKNTVNDYTLIVTEDISINGTLRSSKDISVNSLTIGIGAGDISSNSVFGYQTLLNNTTGYKNTASGFQALNNNTTGSYNTAIGYDSGTGNNSGAYNTFVGASANANSDSYNYSTALGYNAIITASNQIVLGNSSITSLNCQVQTITSVSDVRDKKNIQPLTNGIAFVEKLNPVKFEWNMRDGGKVDIPEMGFIAQDLQQVQEETGIVVPGLVSDSNPDRLEASYGTLIPILVKAIQDLSEQVTELKTANATLQSQLNSIMTILTNNNLS